VPAVLRARSDQLAVGVLFIVIAGMGCFAPVQSDTWWLLRAGRDILATHHVSLVDTYSWTAAGLYWPNHEWLTEVVFYGLFSAGGLPLVSACCATMIVLAWALCWRLTRGSFEARFLIFGICVNTSASVWAVRPQVFTMLFFVATCALLVRRRVWWLPVVLLVWVNFHGAVLLGLVAIAAACGAELIVERRMPWRLAAVGIVSFGATFLSPMGAGLWPFVLHSVEKSRINQLIEWQPPGFALWLWPFWILAAAMLVLPVMRWRALDRETGVLAAIALGLLPLAVQSQRTVPVFLLAAIPAVSRLIVPADPARAAAPVRLRGERQRLNGWLLIASGVIAVFIVTGGWIAPPARLGWTPIAPAAAAAIRDCGAPLYNTYGDGGVLIWFVPEQKVFIDNRQDPYPLDVLRINRAAELEGRFADLEQRFAPRCTAVAAASAIAAQLSGDSSWQRRYADAQWVVYVKTAGR
jgi:hypothetical protein